MLQTSAKNWKKYNNSPSVKYVDLTELNETLGKPSQSGDERESKTFHLPKIVANHQAIVFIEKRKYYILFWVTFLLHYVIISFLVFLLFFHGLITWRKSQTRCAVLIFLNEIKQKKYFLYRNVYCFAKTGLKWPDFQSGDRQITICLSVKSTDILKGFIVY